MDKLPHFVQSQKFPNITNLIEEMRVCVRPCVPTPHWHTYLHPHVINNRFLNDFEIEIRSQDTFTRAHKFHSVDNSLTKLSSRACSNSTNPMIIYGRKGEMKRLRTGIEFEASFTSSQGLTNYTKLLSLSNCNTIFNPLRAE